MLCLNQEKMLRLILNYFICWKVWWWAWKFSGILEGRGYYLLSSFVNVEFRHCSIHEIVLCSYYHQFAHNLCIFMGSSAFHSHNPGESIWYAMSTMLICSFKCPSGYFMTCLMLSVSCERGDTILWLLFSVDQSAQRDICYFLAPKI